MLNLMAPLKYLDFDFSEDSLGVGTFEAITSTQAAHVAAIRSEIAIVLGWAYSVFPDLKAPLDEGGEWDYHLQGLQEWTAHEVISFDEKTRQVTSRVNPAGPPRHTMTLSLCGGPQFCAAFRAQFEYE
jgi:hypothetical protein